MAENTSIGWTDHSHNFWWGCNKVSPECHHCYIDSIMRRAGRVPFGGPNEGTRIVTDGLLDGVVRQAWPCLHRSPRDGQSLDDMPKDPEKVPTTRLTR
jgi:hypothetical protein